MEEIKEVLEEQLTSERLIKAVFSDARKKSLPYRQVTARPVLLHGNRVYQVEYRYRDHVTHENLPGEEFLSLGLRLILTDFSQINLFGTDSDIQILAKNPAHPKVIRSQPSKAPGKLSHNNEKQYLIPDGSPCPFLIRLGVMDEKGKVFQKHYSKFRQINRFLEIVGNVADRLPPKGTLRILDFGCGKAYLTFALYHYFTVISPREISIIGLDLKESTIDFCNKVSEDLNYMNLRFAAGDIADHKEDSCDMVVTLHACDTATDLALINAADWGAKVILSVPCCQHELFDQIENPLHTPMFRHGILKERFTEILTDGLRGLALESRGYEVDMIEFTSLEHTARNIMIRATLPEKQNSDKSAKAAEQFCRLEEYWHVSSVMNRLLP